MRIGYGRVSTRDQNLNSQTDALRAAGCEEWFVDKASGKLARRPELDRALLRARAGDKRREAAPPPLPQDFDQPPPKDLPPISLTVPEIGHLHTVLTRVWQPISHYLHWSLWRRCHQSAARWYHHRARLALAVPP